MKGAGNELFQAKHSLSYTDILWGVASPEKVQAYELLCLPTTDFNRPQLQLTTQITNGTFFQYYSQFTHPVTPRWAHVLYVHPMDFSAGRAVSIRTFRSGV